jgi:hypothetical protein
MDDNFVGKTLKLKFDTKDTRALFKVKSNGYKLQKERLLCRFTQDI